jgi:hypothetical protein
VAAAATGAGCPIAAPVLDHVAGAASAAAAAAPALAALAGQDLTGPGLAIRPGIAGIRTDATGPAVTTNAAAAEAAADTAATAASRHDQPGVPGGAHRGATGVADGAGTHVRFAAAFDFSADGAVATADCDLDE